MTEKSPEVEHLEQILRSLLQRVEKLEKSRTVPVIESLDIKIIKPLKISPPNLVKIYNDIPEILLEYAVRVSLTTESYRQKTQGAVLLQQAPRGNYWVIWTETEFTRKYWLVPNGNTNFNIFRLDSVKHLFRLEGEELSRDTEFILKEPAQVNLLPNGQQWQLEKLGVLYLGQNIPVPEDNQDSNTFPSQKLLPVEELLNRLANADGLNDYVEQVDRRLQQLERTLEVSNSPDGEQLTATYFPRSNQGRNRTTYVPVKKLIYAGFWQRFLACIIDSIPLLLIWSLSITLFVGGIELELLNHPLVLIATFITFLISWLYYSLMESSPLQATLGKLVIGIVVVDTEGNKITWSRASLRFFSKIVSGLILLWGFIMAALTTKKQALHDLISNCLVIKSRK